ncbi:MAG: prolyl oligopeptidase family serine peptidase [Acidobacteria bacterium]|nr:prolyl oligopeptidase family serine peptidase [Acidobacteriota bacterium]
MAGDLRRPLRAQALACALVLSALTAALGPTREAAIQETLVRIRANRALYEPHTYVDGNGPALPYRLFKPAEAAGRKYPLVVFLHGGNGVGTENVAQISGGNALGAGLWLLPEIQADHPCFVLAPQAIHEWEETGLTGYILLVSKLIESLEKDLPIDASRVYVTGQSSGGYGTWVLTEHRPDLVAAAAPICGGGVPAKAAEMSRVPVWAFHGSDDQVVDPAESRRMVAALRKAGGDPKYTEYPGRGHDVWNVAYTEPDFVPWLFAQHRAPVSSAGH